MAYAESPNELPEIKGQIRKSTGLRTPGELKALGAAMRASNYRLTRAQTEEGTAIIADAKGHVTGRRPEESDLTQQEVARDRLDRLDSLLNRVTTVQEDSYPKDQKFDPKLYDKLTREVRSGMGDLGEAEARFNEIVARYRDRLAPEK